MKRSTMIKTIFFLFFGYAVLFYIENVQKNGISIMDSLHVSYSFEKIESDGEIVQCQDEYSLAYLEELCDENFYAENSEECYDEFYESNSNIVFSEYDIQNLILLVYCEAGMEPYEGQVAVVATVMNRLQSGMGTTISEVIFAPYQFSCIQDNIFYIGENPVSYEQIDNWIDTESIRQAVYAGLDGEDPTEGYLGGFGALYYYNPDITPDDELEFRQTIGDTIRIGNHVFYNEWF